MTAIQYWTIGLVIVICLTYRPMGKHELEIVNHYYSLTPNKKKLAIWVWGSMLLVVAIVWPLVLFCHLVNLLAGKK